MIQGLLWIVGSYGISIALVHLSHAKHQRDKQKPLHYVLVTHNNQRQVEWYVRSLFLFAWLKSKEIKITIWDEGSIDHTLDIIHRLTLHRNVDIYVPDDGREFEHEQTIPLINDGRIVIHLSHHEDPRKAPLFQ